MERFVKIAEDLLSRRTTQCVLLIGLVFALSTLVHIYASYEAMKWSAEIGQSWESKSAIERICNFQSAGSEPYRARIQTQLVEAQTRANHHFMVMKDFYSWYYMAIVMAALTAGAAALALFWISKRGWARAPEGAITLFAIMSTAALFYQAFPGMFKQEQNIAENKRLYLKYVALQDEIRSYCVTGEDEAGIARTPAYFIHAVDVELATNNNLAIGFDSAKAPSYGDLRPREKGEVGSK